MVTVTGRLTETWLEGECNGATGLYHIKLFLKGINFFIQNLKGMSVLEKRF